MRGKDLLEGLNGMETRWILEAEAPPRRSRRPGRWLGAVAALAVCCVLSLPVFAAAVPPFYEALYALSPATAQRFKPVQRSCEDQGIRMEVAAVSLYENTAQLYVTLQDLTSTRLDETTDLFDSYRIHTPFDATGHCQAAGYDPETKTASFLITVEQWGDEPVQGKKLTFSVRDLLSGKRVFEGALSDVDLTAAERNPATQSVELRGSSGDVPRETMAMQVGRILAAPTDGVAITGLGYVQGTLRVQTRYDDILETDNHGSTFLRNRITGERIPSRGSISFFQEGTTDSIQEELFPDLPPEALGDYELCGEFVTSRETVSGHWSVTIPLEDQGSDDRLSH